MGIFQKLLGGGKDKGGKMGELLQTLTADLQLNPGQIDHFKETFRRFRQKRKEIKSSGGTRADIQNARQEMKDQLMTALNDQQRQIFTANAAKYDAILHAKEE